MTKRPKWIDSAAAEMFYPYRKTLLKKPRKTRAQRLAYESLMNAIQRNTDNAAAIIVKHAPEKCLIPCVSSSTPGELILLCPNCGSNMIHPVAVDVVPAGKHGGSVTITADGFHVDKSREPIGRGVAIALSFVCEDGCAFKYELHFHKGSTSMNTHVLDSDEYQWGDTIWRD